MKKEILVPFDGSAHATAALRVAIEMAEAFDERIILLNVQPSYETPHTKEFFSKNEIADYRFQRAVEVMKPGEEILKQSGVAFVNRMRVGDPREQICLEARTDEEERAAGENRGIHLIVMGSRGLSRFLGTVLGSVSMGVLHDTPCPVIIVPLAG